MSDEGRDLLGELHASQFLFPDSWKVPKDWQPSQQVPQCKGYLDLYSGQKGIARAVVSAGDTLLSWKMVTLRV